MKNSIKSSKLFLLLYHHPLKWNLKLICQNVWQGHCVSAKLLHGNQGVPASWLNSSRQLWVPLGYLANWDQTSQPVSWCTLRTDTHGLKWRVNKPHCTRDLRDAQIRRAEVPEWSTILLPTFTDSNFLNAATSNTHTHAEPKSTHLFTTHHWYGCLWIWIIWI